MEAGPGWHNGMAAAGGTQDGLCGGHDVSSRPQKQICSNSEQMEQTDEWHSLRTPSPKMTTQTH
jgi:hypothetical protein